MSQNYENYIREVLKKAKADLNDNEYNQLLKFDKCTSETFLSSDYRTIAKSLAKTESDCDYNYDRYMKYFCLQYIKSVSKDEDTTNYRSCIEVIKFIKERGFELNIIEKIMAQKLIQTIDIGDIQIFIHNYRCLQEIDLNNLMINNQMFFDAVCLEIELKKNEKYDFVKLIETIYGFNTMVSNDVFENLFLALVYMAYNDQNLLSYLKLSNLYIKYFKNPNDKIQSFRESLISQTFSKIPITSNIPSHLSIKIGQRIINNNSITYSVHQSNFNSLKCEVSLITSFLSLIQMKQIESISIAKVQNTIQVSLNLNSKVFGLNLYINPSIRLPIQTFYYIFLNISQTLLKISSYPIKVCFSPQCILIDSENANCLLLPDFCFCSVPKGTDANLDFEAADENKNYFIYGIANLMEEILEILDGDEGMLDEVKVIIEKIRKVPGVTLEHVFDYFSSKINI